MGMQQHSDNNQQVAEIIKFCSHLEEMIGHAINPEVAAHIWIRKFAKAWRNEHPFQ